jgi:hypothetical protein
MKPRVVELDQFNRRLERVRETYLYRMKINPCHFHHYFLTPPSSIIGII